MKKLASILAVTLAAGVLATGCGSSSGSASKDSSSDSGKTVIKAATGANAKPYVYVGDDDKPAGYDVDVLNAVFNKLPDYELEYEVTDFGSVLSGLNSGNYQIGVNNFSYNEDRGASYLYSYPYDKISYVFVTKKGGKEIKSFEDAAGLSFEGGTGISVSNAVEAWNEKNPDKAINITYSDADTSVFLQHVADGSQDFTIIDLAMYNSYMETIIRDICQVVSSRGLQSQEHLRWSQSFYFWMSRHLHWIRSLSEKFWIRSKKRQMKDIQCFWCLMR